MSLECKIELDKKGGIKITVLDADGKTEQTIEMDGKQLVMTVKDQSDTSVYTQKPDGVTIKCKKFKVDADEIETKSSKATKIEADGSMDLKSTQTMTLKSSQDAQFSATTDMIVKGMTLKAEGQTQADLKAMTVNVKADMNANVQGLMTKLEGQTTCDVKGLMVTVKSDAIMDIEGMLTTVKGQLTNVNGTLVNLGP